MMNNRLNKYKYPGAKRLMLEAQELREKTEDYCAQPIDDNLFEWHFTVRGPPETPFGGGFYHGRLSFPTEYPMKPPSIILLTPNGRFETNKKICLSISGHHPETWQPSWSVRTALLALVAFMPTKTNRAIGSLDFSDAERRKLAENSRTWRCETCGPIKDLLKQPEDVCNMSECEASTSRVAVAKDSSQINSERQLDRKSLATSNPSDSDEEARDSSTDSRGSGGTTSTNGSDSDASSSSSSSSTKRERIEVEEAGNESHKNDSTPTLAVTPPQEFGSRESRVAQQQQSSTSGQTTITNTIDENRSYPPLVIISISVLLFLLILRRIVMMLQAQ